MPLTSSLGLHATELSSFRDCFFFSFHLKGKLFSLTTLKSLHLKQQTDPNHTPEHHHVHPPRIQPPRGPRAAATYVYHPRSTQPLLTPPLKAVTGSFAAPFTAYFALLSARVVYQRVHEKVFIGEDTPSSKHPVLGAPVDTKSKKSTTSIRDTEHHQDYNPLTIATRSHANFVEHVPLALVLAAAAELNGGSKKALTTALGVLLAARVLHVEFGLRSPGATGMGRAVGWWGTMGAMGWLAGYGGWLVRGYWGVKE